VRDFKRDFKRDDRPQTMFKTICSDCGKECEVPFKPNGSKPVFCRDCFQGKRRFEGPKPEFQRRPNFDDRAPHQGPPPPPPHKAEFEALNVKLDKILKLLVKEEPIAEIEAAIAEPVTVEKVKVAKAKSPVVKKKKAAKK
jgi:CxxC-x17-CxxC domain-containing protein